MGRQPIKTAPRDGSVIKVKTFEGRVLRAFFNQGAFENDEGPVGGWQAADDEEGYPDCWHDGVCWASNADGVRSDPPMWWEPVQ